MTTLCQTLRQLRSLGHEVLIFAPDGGPAEFEGFRVVRVRGHAFPSYPELRLALPHASLGRILQEFRPDVIHAAEPALLGIAALYYGGGNHGGALHVPLVVSYHTDLPKYLAYYGLRFLEPRIWRLLRLRHNRAALNLCTSRIMASQLEQHRIPRVALWPGGVDTDQFQPARRSAAMRSRLTGGHPDSPLLLYVGRLSAEKEIERILPILDANPGARLALVGGGPNRRALEHHFAGRPVEFTGFLRGDELAEAFASSDVFVMPSRTETLGLVVLEAMASGLTVIGVRAGGIPEMIDDRVNGFLFDDEGQAADCVARLLASPEERQAVGRAARMHALDWTWEKATLRLVEHYRAARELQQTAPNSRPSPEHPTLRLRARAALTSATLFTIRKLLP